METGKGNISDTYWSGYLAAIKAAFPLTIPVMFGYVFLGIAFGVLLSDKGLSWLWALAMSTFIFGGSMQFVTLDLITVAFAPVQILLVTLMVHARHIFYGFSMLKPFSDVKKVKPYLIFALSDETYSLLCSAKVPDGVDKSKFYFFIAFLDQIYWIIGSIIGAVAGNIIPFNSTGIDFAMTALFLVIFTEQWESAKSKIPAVSGLIVTIACRIIFDVDKFLIFSMLGIACALIIFKKQIEKGGE